METQITLRKAQMVDNFTPLLFTQDWNEEWMQLQKMRKRADSSKYWDGRAPSFGSKDSPNPYVVSFLEKANLDEQDSVLDMGCGNGALSVPLGKLGHHVIAADFSRVMLDMLSQSLDENKIDQVQTLLMSWDDNWADHGIQEDCVDVAFASRSIATQDLEAALLKLTKAARKRVCITLSTGSTPRCNPLILEVAGIFDAKGYDFQYALNILINNGFRPDLSYIISTKTDYFASPEEALSSYTKMALSVRGTQNISDETIKNRIESWLGSHLRETSKPKSSDEKYYLDQPRKMIWAFISWDTKKPQ